MDFLSFLAAIIVDIDFAEYRAQRVRTCVWSRVQNGRKKSFESPFTISLVDSLRVCVCVCVCVYPRGYVVADNNNVNGIGGL